MAIYRKVALTFWTDSKISDDFTANDKYLYLYLFTNPHTNLCGCYEVSMKQMSYETGLDIGTVKKLIDRMMNTHKVILYDEDTKEVLLLHWYKYNWTTSEKFRKPLEKEIHAIKSQTYREYLTQIFNGTDTVSIPYPYPIDTTVTDTVSIPYPYPIDTTVTDTVSDTVTEQAKEVIDYFNEKCGTKYRYSQTTLNPIKARLKDFTVEDCKKVIDTKAREWLGDDDMAKYLRPSTLFRPSNFEEYLNQVSKPKVEKKPTLSQEQLMAINWED